ncbi:MarR family winged helix-turn-helix transcriptional regulator [Ferrovibrio sp.]|uniref:MarR family winged helix-turn-helix transcriptional regulator n=1 Tax=Ferrovibrio sp. TaxID=1917215 RepID=UPI000CAF33E1|nr:MarR family transcriptional regulator [Ferrovibrio sp.]PJI44368.1 MAG: transcriptional regulator [Ferrovibrio sp.]
MPMKKAQVAEPPRKEAKIRKLDRGPLPDLYGYNLRIAQVAVFGNFIKVVGSGLAGRMGGLTPGRFSLLVLLRANPGINQTDLSRGVGVDKSTLTPALDQLEKKGLILRQRTAADRRTYSLSLSPAGEQLLSELMNKVEQHERNIIAGLTPSERVTLTRLLKKMARSLGSEALG